METVLVSVVVIPVCFLSGWYVYCHLYGVNNVLGNTVGYPGDNPMINGLRKFLFSYPDLLASRWVIIPLFLIHLVFLGTAMLVTIATLFMSLTESGCIWIMALPYVIGAGLRYMLHRRNLSKQQGRRY
ncbi:MAG: hypothetical protein ABIH67_03635 [Candidatus Uhrbacteria bacterium]